MCNTSREWRVPSVPGHEVMVRGQVATGQVTYMPVPYWHGTLCAWMSWVNNCHGSYMWAMVLCLLNCWWPAGQLPPQKCTWPSQLLFKCLWLPSLLGARYNTLTDCYHNNHDDCPVCLCCRTVPSCTPTGCGWPQAATSQHKRSLCLQACCSRCLFQLLLACQQCSLIWSGPLVPGCLCWGRMLHCSWVRAPSTWLGPRRAA